MRGALLMICLMAAGSVAAAGCKKNAPSDTDSTTNSTTSDSKAKAPKMTDMDPSSPAAWEQAKAIAATASTGQLDKRSDALPFMFMADVPAAVLVHEGAVVTKKGAAVAGAYLRDLGVIEGTGPKIADILFVLFALDAWPTIAEAKPEAYINVPGDKRLEDLTARVDHDGQSAQVVLHYFLPDKTPPPEESEDDEGDVDPDHTPSVLRRVARATLEINKSGDAAWKVTEVNWAEPRE